MNKIDMLYIVLVILYFWGSYWFNNNLVYTQSIISSFCLRFLLKILLRMSMLPFSLTFRRIPLSFLFHEVLIKTYIILCLLLGISLHFRVWILKYSKKSEENCISVNVDKIQKRSLNLVALNNFILEIQKLDFLICPQFFIFWIKTYA